MILHPMLHSLMLDPYYTHTATLGDQELRGGPQDAVEPQNLALLPAGCRAMRVADTSS